MYNTILFDLDDTLLDFTKSEQKALKRVFESFNIPFTTENISEYKLINHELWVDFELGKIPREAIFHNRFPKYLANHGYAVVGDKVDIMYRDFLAEGHDIKDGAEEMLQQLKSRGDRLYVVTNGLMEMQQRRLQDSQLLKYFDDVFISEQTGFKKPDIGFFDYVFARIPNLQKEKTVIVGDMLHADILGGVNAGIDTIWMNERAAIKYVDVTPTYTVHSLEQLHQLLLGREK